MANRSKDKGDRAEREVQALLNDLLGLTTVRRKLGAGRADDMGDIDGVPDTCVQVAWYANLTTALREKVPACAVQQDRMGALFGATFLRKTGGGFVVAMTPEQFATLWREATRPDTEGPTP